jgi:hypothetical protein
VQSIFYDLHDAANDDGVALGFSPLYDVLHDDMPAADSFSSVFGFIAPLKSNMPGSAAAINALVSAQGITDIADDFATGESNDIGSTSKLPVYANSTGVFCNTREHGEYNKLGNYRFIEVSGSGSTTFTATRDSSSSLGSGSTDPDLALYHQGQLVGIAESYDPDSETLTYNLQAGLTYILSVYEYSYVDNATGPAQSEACFNVTW